MRALIWITAVLSLAYGGYWVVASSQVRAGATRALDEMRADGRADYSAVSLSGFPSRFDLTITDPVISDGQASWRAPFLQVFALSYRPNHIIAVWPHEQTLAVAGQSIAVTSDDMRASAVFGAQTALPLDRSTFVASALRLASDADWGLGLAELRAATERAGGDPLRHKIGLEARGLAPSPALKSLIDPQGILPSEAEILRLDATLDFDRALDRLAGEGGGPRLLALTLTEARLGWGDLVFSAAGSLTFDPAGVPQGRIDLRAESWREMLRLAVAAGVVQPDAAPALERGLEQVALAGGAADVVELPLTFAGGWINLGLIPLGPAPRLGRSVSGLD